MSKTQYIALLRGINVGGKNIIKMADLKECLEAAGFRDVRTYIASGNVLFGSSNIRSKVEADIDDALKKRFGYRGPTVVLSATDFRTVIQDAPRGFGSEPDNIIAMSSY